MELTRPPVAPASPVPKDTGAAGNPISRMFANMFGTGGGKPPEHPHPHHTASTGGATSAAAGAAAGGGSGNAHQHGGPQGGLDPYMGRGYRGASVDDMGSPWEGGRDSLDGSRRQLVVRDGPGAVLVTWAETEGGALMIERAYSRSTGLDGEAVVIFMRALCAVSQEELDGLGAVGHGARIRVHSLQKVVECAYHNMGRIRLVWSKLWAVIAAQLVGASCHPDRRVALYAVDSLRQLVAKLLARAELVNFTHQEEALRPFVAVLRQSDEASVRELAAQCVMQVGT